LAVAKLEKLGKAEKDYLVSKELCRLATASADATPLVTPVIYALDSKNIVIVTDYGTKKLKNLRENPKIALVVDDYHPNRGVIIFGNCELHEKGKEYLRLLRILFAKFETYRRNPWGEGESPILKIIPTRIVSCGYLRAEIWPIDEGVCLRATRLFPLVEGRTKLQFKNSISPQLWICQVVIRSWQELPCS
jgi:pyridoxamine 5'-phosphate oxidase family protein